VKVFSLTIHLRFGYFRYRFLFVFSSIFVSIFVFVNEFDVFSLTDIFVFVFVNEINTVIYLCNCQKVATDRYAVSARARIVWDVCINFH